MDILTSRAPGGYGAIAKYLAKFGEGVQQVEFRCLDVDRATEILKEKFGIAPVYPETRAGADGTWVNFFLVAVPGGGKILIELYELAGDSQGWACAVTENSRTTKSDKKLQGCEVAE